MKLKFSIFVILLFFFFIAQTPSKKRKELENCKITVDSLEIKNFRMFLIPPVPKLYFTANIQIENTNEVPVTIEKFAFKVSTVEGGNEATYIAEVEHKSEHTIAARSTEIIQADMQTLFEENVNKNSLFFRGLGKSSTWRGRNGIYFRRVNWI